MNPLNGITSAPSTTRDVVTSDAAASAIKSKPTSIITSSLKQFLGCFSLYRNMPQVFNMKTSAESIPLLVCVSTLIIPRNYLNKHKKCDITVHFK